MKSLSFAGDSNSLAVPCGNEIVICDSSSWLLDRDAVKRTPVKRLKVDNDEPVGKVMYSPDSKWMAITTAVKAGEPGCSLLLYAQSDANDGTEEWKLHHTRPLMNEGE